jgi:YD repeat-containing protein
VEHTKVISYDELGRPLDQRQRFKTNSVWSTEYRTQRGYNLAGGVTSQTYPSDRTVNYAYDNAGRLNSFSGDLGGGVTRDYSTEIVYSSLGGMAKEKFATDTPLYNKSFTTAADSCQKSA